VVKTIAREDVCETRLADALSERYLAYALSTITARSLPDVRDGLKPVHRRLLYAMQQLKLAPEAGYKKCARVVGDVMGKYHPHGDQAIYDSMVRLAQEFSVRYPLVEGQGNFGNIDGDNAAAMRYTESRLTKVAWTLLDGIDRDAVDFRSTYDGEENEPIVLPARFPNLLSNGASGIAVGMATSIPPHNAGEICRALLHLIKFPRVTFDKLVDFIPGPDFPTGGEIVEPRENILKAYKTGHGTFRLRACWTRENLNRGQYQIVISEIPYNVQKSRLIEKMAELLNARKLPMLGDIRDESTEKIRIILEPKTRTIDAQLLMEHLYKQTDLEVKINLNMNVLNAENIPGVMNLREILQAFLNHRHEVLIRETNFRLDKIEQRLDILNGLLVAYLNLDEVIKIIRERDDAKADLKKNFHLTETQADAILNMRLRQLRKLEEIKIQEEYNELSKEQKNLKALLKDKSKRWKIIAGDITNISKSFGLKTPLGKRQTKIGKPPAAVIVPIEAMIEKEPVTIIFSKKGWIRAARGHIENTYSIKFKEGDNLRFAVRAETTSKLIIFASNGRFYTLGVDKLPSSRGHGEPLRLMIDLPNNDEVVDMFLLETGRKFIVVSDTGRGFIVNEEDVVAQTKNGKQILNLKPDQKATKLVIIEQGHEHVAIIGSNRKLLIFPINEIPIMARGSGVMMQRYTKGSVADLTTLKLREGLTWQTGAGVRCETNITKWVGKRAQAGQLPFKGFPKANQFK
tara:strand:- start:1502 stop:3730 length:2229 start_codon:yes stop_codon:yes gene_type:complete